MGSLLTTCASTPKAQSSDHLLHGNGADVVEIIVSENPSRSAKLAAKELQEHLQRLSGVTIPMLTKMGKRDSYKIYVGQSKFTKEFQLGSLSPGEIVIKGDENHLLLLGEDWDYEPPEGYVADRAASMNLDIYWQKSTRHVGRHPYTMLFKNYNADLDIWSFDKKGTLNAVYTYLQELGFRWYSPGDIGEVLPKLDAIPSRIFSQRSAPDFPVRRMAFYGKNYFQSSREELLWQLRLGLNTGIEILGDLPIGHGMANVYGTSKMRREHPDYFALLNGERDTLSRSIGKPCLSIEGLRQENIAYLKQVFEDFDVPAISVMPGDAFYHICECHLCTGKDTPERGVEGKLSDYVWDYVNDVATEIYKSYPEKKITCFAYGTYLLPPTKIAKLSPNIIVGICQNRSTFHNEAQRIKYENIRNEWLKKVENKELLIWDYYLHARPGKKLEGFPAIFTKTIAKDIRDLKGKSSGDFIEVYRSTSSPERSDLSLATNHLNVYVTAKLLWDGDLDLDELIRDYTQQFYGPAQQEMLEFFLLAEAQWHTLREKGAQIKTLFDLLEKAQVKVQKTSAYARRIQNIADYISPLQEISQAKKKRSAPEARLRFVHGNSKETSNGLGSSAFWQPHYPFPLRSNDDEGPNKTTVKVAHTPNGVHMLVQCHEENMAGMVEHGRNNDDRRILSGEHLELLLETSRHSYYRIVISAAGYFLVSDGRNRDPQKWNSDLQIDVQRTSDKWTAEIFIPMKIGESPTSQSILGRQPTEAIPWYFNLVRRRRNVQGNLEAYFNHQMSDGFHNPEHFVRLYKR